MRPFDGQGEKMNLKQWIVCLGVFAAMSISACQTQHQVAVEPVEVKPIHITIDVNVRVDKALDDFFGEIDAAGQQQ
jgi:hypothetical protein